MSRRTSPDLAARWSWFHTELTRAPVTGVFTMGRAVGRYDLRDRVAALRRTPAAVVLTTQDTVCAPRSQRQLADQLGARVLELPDDHDVPIVRPAAFATAVLTGIADVRARAGR